MKKFRKVFTIGAIVLAMGVTSVAGFAVSLYKTPAEAVAGLTERTVESVILERQETNKTYGTIADEAGKLDEFKKESIEMKKDNLNAQVKAGTITQEKADTIIKAIEENQVNCDGTGSEKIGQKEGAKFGSNGLGQGLKGANRGQGQGQAAGQGQKQGQGQRQGQAGQGQGQGGMRLQDGTCNLPGE